MVEIVKKLNDNKQISAKEEDFVKRIENERSQSLHIKKKTQNLSETFSNVILKHKDAFNLKKLADHLKKKPNENGTISTQSKSKNSSGSKKKVSIVTKNFNSQLGIFGMLVSNKQSNFFELKSAKTFEKLKNDNDVNDLREKVTDLNERMKEEIQKDLKYGGLMYKKINGRGHEEFVKERKDLK